MLWTDYGPMTFTSRSGTGGVLILALLIAVHRKLEVTREAFKYKLPEKLRP